MIVLGKFNGDLFVLVLLGIIIFIVEIVLAIGQHIRANHAIVVERIDGRPLPDHPEFSDHLELEVAQVGRPAVLDLHGYLIQSGSPAGIVGDRLDGMHPMVFELRALPIVKNRVCQ